MIWSVSQQLAHKKHASTVGSVYWRGSENAPTLLLLPPTAETTDNNHNNKNNKKVNKRAKQAHGNENNNTRPKTQRLRFRVELHFGMDTLDWIQPQIRLVPNRCNLSSSNQYSHMYNYQLTETAAHCFSQDLESHSRALKEKYPHWNDVVVLAKIWCLQRGLLNRHDGLCTEHIALLVLYIYRTKLAGPRMSASHVLTALFKLWAETDWLGERESKPRIAPSENDNNLIRKAPSEGGFRTIETSRRKRTVLVLPRDEKSMMQTIAEAEMALVYARQTKESPLTPNDPKTLLELYETTYTLGPVFLDSSMTHNYLGRISPAYMRSLQRHAQQGLDFVHSKHVTKPFPLLFMTEVRFFQQYDAYLQIPLKDISFKSSTLWGNDRNDVGDYESIARGLIRVLRSALGDRVVDVQLLSSGNGRVSSTTTTTSGRIGLDDSDEIPCYPVSNKALPSQGITAKLSSPNGREDLVLGLSLNSDTCFRTVDRGPSADTVEATQRFVELWGKDRAQLRRFKDGAIVYAVVWDGTGKDKEDSDASYVRFQNDDQVQGGIVERIIRHILKQHFLRKDKGTTASFALRNLLSTVDGVIPDDNTTVTFNPLVAHKWAMKAFEELSSFLRNESLPTLSVPGSDKFQSRLGIPLQIDAVEPLSPVLRYAELFPPIPHPLLGGPSLPGFHKVSGVISSTPIRIQIRFGSSSKWPTDIRAIGAAKTAMLLQLVNGIKEMQHKGFASAATYVTPDYADICYKGYVFRVFVRADPELKFLGEMIQPSDEALTLLKALTNQHVVAAKHHSMVHGVYNSHPSSSTVVRAAHRWLSAHLFTGLIPFEAVELLVAYVYTSKNSSLNAPGTMVAGLMRFFRLLSSHDWEGEPLVIDPHDHLNDDDHVEIKKEFDALRGPERTLGPPMFIVAPYDRGALDDIGDNDTEGVGIKATSRNVLDQFARWRPSYTYHAPEKVSLGRMRQLAERSYQFMLGILAGGSRTDLRSCGSALFQESSKSFQAFSVLLRVDSDLILDKESSSSTESDLSIRRNDKLGVWQSSYSRSMYSRYLGPKAMQIKVYKNLMDQEDQSSSLLLEWNPIDEMVNRIRQELGQFAVFWYNGCCPEVVTVLWRPNLFAPKSFSAISSEYARPVVEKEWQKDTFVTLSVSDILRELMCFTKDMVVGQKVFDYGMEIVPQHKTSGKRGSAHMTEDASDDEDDKDESSSGDDSSK